MKRYHRWIALLIALVVGAIAGFVCLYALVEVAMRTGVIAMCAWAPQWWAWTLLILTPLFTVGGATAAAFASARWYRARCGQTEI